MRNSAVGRVVGLGDCAYILPQTLGGDHSFDWGCHEVGQQVALLLACSTIYISMPRRCCLPQRVDALERQTDVAVCHCEKTWRD